jgi:hypothetical protein
VLHPRHKLSYFKSLHWLPDWIQTTEDLIRAEYNRSYATKDDLGDIADVEVNSNAPKVSQPSILLILHANILKGKYQNIFDTMPSLAAPTRSDLCDELTVYLSSDPELVKDVLAWWYDKCTTYPTLHRMALDYLSIPGMFIVNFYQILYA